MLQEEIWLEMFFFLIVFCLVYMITYFTNLRKWKKKQYKKIGEYNYLMMKFHLDGTKLILRKMLLWFSLMDALIIAFVTTFITMLDIGIMWQLLIGFVLLFALIYAIYEIYGRSLVKKGYQKRERK